MAIAAFLYDGVTAERQHVEVEPAAGALGLIYAEGRTEVVQAGLLRRMGSDGESLRLGRTDVPGWRLLLPEEAEAALRPLLGREERYGRWIDRIGLVPALAGFAIVSAAVVAAGYLAPHWIAPHVPESWEHNLGTAIVGDFGDNRCPGAEGQRALDGLVERLAPGATQGEQPVRIVAIDYPIFNAAALPGGHIVVFDGAIDDIDDPDALAGIVAHEIAHVRRRHVTEALIRELGIGALIRLFAGDIGASAGDLVALSYTREHEAEADADAIEMLRRAGISPAATAELFEHLAEHEEQGAFLSSEFLSSHPLSQGRARKFAAAHDRSQSYRPALTDAQFDAVKTMCPIQAPNRMMRDVKRT